ncbi:hypothetical protein PROFUN_03415 [Planoprotostelium fungivorum]|uniref:DUF4604 domain-containing protein n=1 Tax=Planoprotostelium fungivorum TaxID=1890364 RepID=A0A2P6NWJ6_9EUKA|nr:hypothetical protein PROFUN_03415 [Planoprotostelium fungivorum]
MLKSDVSFQKHTPKFLAMLKTGNNEPTIHDKVAGKEVAGNDRPDYDDEQPVYVADDAVIAQLQAQEKEVKHLEETKEERVEAMMQAAKKRQMEDEDGEQKPEDANEDDVTPFKKTPKKQDVSFASTKKKQTQPEKKAPVKQSKKDEKKKDQPKLSFNYEDE